MNKNPIHETRTFVALFFGVRQVNLGLLAVGAVFRLCRVWLRKLGVGAGLFVAKSAKPSKLQNSSINRCYRLPYHMCLSLVPHEYSSTSAYVADSDFLATMC